MQVDLDPSQQGAVKRGDRARITLPGLGGERQGGPSREGRGVRRGGRRLRNDPGLGTPRRSLEGARARQGTRPGGHHDQGGEERSERPGDRARRQIGRRVRRRGRRADGRRELVAVKLGLFDGTDGRVGVEGDLAEGDDVVVPSL